MSSLDLYLEVKLAVDFDYSPYERRILYPNEDAHPGCDASITINDVVLDGLDIINLLDADQLQALEQQIWDSRQEPDEDTPRNYRPFSTNGGF